jgi:hypothetical protein
MNTSVLFLPVLPAVTGDTMVLVTGIVLHIAIAFAVVVIAGPARLTRSRHPLPVSPWVSRSGRRSSSVRALEER